MTRSVSAIAVLVAAALVVVLAAGVGAADEGLVAEWHFDEGAGGVLVDSSGNGNDGTIYGATWTERVSRLQLELFQRYLYIQRQCCDKRS